jgi:hypothetical protein
MWTLVGLAILLASATHVAAAAVTPSIKLLVVELTFIGRRIAS